MSFYGSIGHLMAGSGLQSLFELIYAENTVPHIFSGKAFSRATRGHLITTGTLYALLMLKVNNIDFDTDAEDDEFLAKLHETLRRND